MELPMRAEKRKKAEHPPTLLIQQIRLEWYKDCRGGNAAAQRNQYPKAMPAAKGLLLLSSIWFAHTLCVYHTETRRISYRKGLS